jgi:hypothetical protein
VRREGSQVTDTQSKPVVRELATFMTREDRPEWWSVVRTPLLDNHISIVCGCRFHESWIFWKVSLGMESTNLPGRIRGRDIALKCHIIGLSALSLSIASSRGFWRRSSIWLNWILSSRMRVRFPESFGFSEREPFTTLMP